MKLGEVMLILLGVSFAFAFAVMLSGCATTFEGICGLKPLGSSDAGVAFAAVRCEAVK